MPLRNGRDAHDLGDALLDAIKIIRELYNIPDETQLQNREKLGIMHEEM